MSKKKWFGILFITLFSIFITFFLSKKDSSYLYSDTSDFFSLQEGKGYQGPDWNVWPGQYTFTFTYSASHNIPFSFFADKEVLLEGVFNPCTGGRQRVTLVVPQRTDRLFLSIPNDNIPKDAFTLHTCQIDSLHPFSKDAYFHGFLFFCTGIFLLFFLTSPVFLRLSSSEKLSLLFLFFTGLFTCFPLFRSSIASGWDSWFHLNRLEGIKDGFYSRQFPVMIYPNNYNGFGMAGVLYPNFFFYIPGILRVFHVSILSSYRFLLLAVQIATPFAMYIAMKSMTNSVFPSFTAGFLYALFPYRLSNIYHRQAIGEVLALLFLPLIIAGLFHILYLIPKKGIPFLIIGYTGIIQSHILSCLLVAFFTCFLILLGGRRFFHRERRTSFFLSCLFVLLINLWYIVPFLSFYLSGINEQAFIGNFSKSSSTFLELLGFVPLFDGGSQGILGLIGIACFLIPIFFLIFIKEKREDSLRKTGFFTLFFCGILFLSMTLSFFPWDILNKLSFIKAATDMLQFPFRFHILTSPLLIMAASYFIGNFKEISYVNNIHSLKGFCMKKRQLIAAYFFFLFLSIFSSIGILFTSFFKEGDITILKGGVTRAHIPEYWPKGTTDANFRNTNLFYIDESLQISDYTQFENRIRFLYSTPNEESYLDVPLFYYKGYRAKVIGNGPLAGQTLRTSIGAEHRLRIYLPASLVPVDISLRYIGEWYFHAALFISGITILFFTGRLFLSIIPEKFRQALKHFD